jgi:hypothetical protein
VSDAASASQAAHHRPHRPLGSIVAAGSMLSFARRAVDRSVRAEAPSGAAADIARHPALRARQHPEAAIVLQFQERPLAYRLAPVGERDGAGIDELGHLPQQITSISGSSPPFDRPISAGEPTLSDAASAPPSGASPYGGRARSLPTAPALDRKGTQTTPTPLTRQDGHRLDFLCPCRATESPRVRLERSWLKRNDCGVAPAEAIGDRCKCFKTRAPSRHRRFW